MRPAMIIALLLALSSCKTEAAKQRELSDCTRLYGTAGGLGGCLIDRYHWDSLSAAKAHLGDLKIRQDAGQ